MTNKGLIIVNAYCVYASIQNQANRLKEELENLGITIDIKGNDFGACFIDSNGQIINTIKYKYDFVIYLDKDNYQLSLLELSGTRVFNKVHALMKCDDMMLTNIALANNGIKVPVTLPAPFCSRNISDFDFSSVVKSKLGFPVICKESYQTLGISNFIIYDEKQLKQIEMKLQNKKHFYQEYIVTSRNHDFRGLVVGKKVVACIDRKNKDDTFATLDSQSDVCAYELNEEYRDLVEKVATVLDLDYCGVDLVVGNKGEPIVVNVDANSSLSNIEKLTGVNVAEAYAKYIKNVIYNN